MTIETVYIVHYFLMILIAIYLHYKFRVKWRRVLKLVVLPLILYGIGGFVLLSFGFLLHHGRLEGFLMLCGGGAVSIFMVLYMMFPALLLFAVSMEMVEKRFKPKGVKLFLWAMGLSGSIVSLHTLFMLSDFSSYWGGTLSMLILGSMLLGTLSAMILYGKKEK